ncbi:LysR family transcriptional regulator [Arthrobacter oryzae]|nr:LysR family transcriptional regulator [Arthrobacter oryzae]
MKSEQSIPSSKRLQLLVDLERLGTMSAVTAETGLATSAVSQQLKTLEREVGTALLQADGRLVRLTPAGRVLAERARGILTALQTIPRDLAPDGEPVGTVRLAASTTSLRQRVLPWLPAFTRRYSKVRLELIEAEPREVVDMMGQHRIDIGLVYDFASAPGPAYEDFIAEHLYTLTWGVLVPPASDPDPAGASLPEILEYLRERQWITSSRGPEDEAAIQSLTASAGYRARVQHRVDALDVVESFVNIGLGVALFPASRPRMTPAVLLDTDLASVHQRIFALTRPAWASWPAGRVVLENLRSMAAA